MNAKERVLAHLKGEPVDRLPCMPITMMYAADVIGRPYGEYATDYRVLVEGQLATAEKFGFDYVSCISDPAREAADCGAAVSYFEDQPPAVDEANALLMKPERLQALEIPDPHDGSRMRDRLLAAEALGRQAGDRYLVEGWIEGPCAEAADLRGINQLMMDFAMRPSFVHDLMEFTLQLGLRFAKAQAEAGVRLMGVGDAAASLVGPDLYREFVLPYEKRLVDGLHEFGLLVRLHICGDTNPLLPGMAALGCDIVDLDYMVPLDAARQTMGPEQMLLGNLHPVAQVRDSSPEAVGRDLAICYEQAGPRYIVGAGCEVPRGAPPENVLALSEFARSAPL
jgi:MtaA/CmuA family methyltransferase